MQKKPPKDLDFINAVSFARPYSVYIMPDFLFLRPSPKHRTARRKDCRVDRFTPKCLLFFHPPAIKWEKPGEYLRYARQSRFINNLVFIGIRSPRKIAFIAVWLRPLTSPGLRLPAGCGSATSFCIVPFLPAIYRDSLSSAFFILAKFHSAHKTRVALVKINFSPQIYSESLLNA